MNLIERAKAYLHGQRILSAWLGDGGVAVEHSLAQERSNVCMTCEMNQPGWTPPEKVAEAIKEQVELKNNLNLHVQNEDKLHTCQVCLCPLLLKPWVPLSYQSKYMTKDDIESFPTKCWLRKELYL